MRLNGTRAPTHDVVEIGDVGLVGRHRARAHHGGVQVGHAADHGRPGRDAELVGDLGQQRAEHGARGEQLGQPGAVAPRPGDERVDVAERRAEAVVGEPRRDHRRRRRGGPAGEAQAEVVDRLEDDRGLCVDLGQPRAAAAASGRWGRRRSASARPPVRRTNGSTFCGAKPADADRSADDLAHEVAGAGVGPEQDLADRLAVGADRHRRAPTAR